MTKITYIIGEKAIMDQAKKLSEQAATYRQSLHILLMSALNHIVEHNDQRVLDQVFATVDKALNRRAITIWVKGCSNLQPKMNGETVAFRKPDDEKITIDLDKAGEKPFWDFEEPPVSKPFDLMAAFGILIDKAKKAQNKRKETLVVGEEKKPVDLESYGAFVKELEKFRVSHTIKAKTVKAKAKSRRAASSATPRRRRNTTVAEAPAVH